MAISPGIRNPRTTVPLGQGFDGVVRVTSGGQTSTGVLLFDGQAILTAAHLFTSSSASASVIFETSAGQQTIASRKVLISPTYDSVNANGDVAIVFLGQTAPVAADRYSLYRKSDELNQTFTFVGYGSESGNGNRTLGENRFDAEAHQLKVRLGAVMGWTPAIGEILVADNDNGDTARDALGLFIGNNDLGTGAREGIAIRGDSGGPAFIGKQIAGIASYTAALEFNGNKPDIDSTGNSSFGELGFWQRISRFDEFIDRALRAEYRDAPVKPEDVKKSVVEGQGGTTLAYFLVTFTGTRNSNSDIVSVEYSTRDGTAVAGQDYITASGQLKLYSGENSAVIPVEIIGDTSREQDETFFLDIFNPAGGSFGDGVVTLTAMRTIINDDGMP